MSKIEHLCVEIPFVFTSVNYVQILCTLLKDLFVINITHNLKKQLVLIVSILGINFHLRRVGFSFLYPYHMHACFLSSLLPVPNIFHNLITIQNLHYYYIFHLQLIHVASIFVTQQCAQESSSTGLPWELVKNADSLAPAQISDAFNKNPR